MLYLKLNAPSRGRKYFTFDPSLFCSVAWLYLVLEPVRKLHILLRFQNLESRDEREFSDRPLGEVLGILRAGHCVQK